MNELSTNLLPTYEMRTDELRTDEIYTNVQHNDALHTDGLRLIDNVAYMNRINGICNTSSSSSVLLPTSSSSGRVRGLPGDFHPCGCGCDKQYNGLGMVPCRGCGSVYVNKMCDQTWK